MFRNKSFLRGVAMFLALEVLVSAFIPSITYALTAGPTAPEATSFEPVDTTDMVNTLTGDFVYNLPLLEIPGPAGGYPLSLSYHGGVLTNEEASWVGLGWTLNPGAINRAVNGFADDHNFMEHTDRFFWEGGSRAQMDLGLTLGIAGVADISEGISVGYDTYQGFGVGAFARLGIGFDIGDYGNIGASLNAGVDPWGNEYASAGLGVGLGTSQKKALGMSTSVGISTNFKSVSPYASTGVSARSGNFSGRAGLSTDFKSFSGSASVSNHASIATDGNSSVTSQGVGSFSISNGKMGVISRKSFGFTVPIPWLYLGFKFNRYWTDQMESTFTQGALYAPTTEQDLTYFNNRAFDTYSLNSTNTLAYRKRPETVLQGTFVSFDNYSVNTQGVSGNIRPHSYRTHLQSQHTKHVDNDDNVIYDIIHQPTGYDSSKKAFRFVNDFSNRYVNDFEDFDLNFASGNLPLKYQFKGNPETGITGNDGTIDNEIIAGSKHIEHYTNIEIEHGVSKLIETTSSGFDRDELITGEAAEQIGGFVITNESGVNYHFALPVYSYDEYQFSENIEHGDGHTYNEGAKKAKYAYTWMLTAITGPDFVDRGEPGKIDDEDWGYWVEFDYGKWTDQYVWRNPGEGQNKDLDDNFQNFAHGVKEIYYLDAIKTKTHTALFVKDIRDDAKSALRYFGNGTYSTEGVRLPSERVTPEMRDGGYAPRWVMDVWDEKETGVINLNNYKTFIDYKAKPVSSLKLDKIVLVNNKELENLNIQKNKGEEFNQSYHYTKSRVKFVENFFATYHAGIHDYVLQEYFDTGGWAININGFALDYHGTLYYEDLEGDVESVESHEIIQHLPKNVLDVHDLDDVLIESALRVIEFETDNETIALETANSFDSNMVKTEIVSSTKNDELIFEPEEQPLKGKLALKSVNFKGKKGAGLMPPMVFNYDLSNPKVGTGNVAKLNDSYTVLDRYKLANVNTNLQVGDIIRFNSAGVSVYASINRITDTTEGSKDFIVHIVGRNLPVEGNISWTQTKNPPYNIEAVDEWGLYKGDFKESKNDHLDRLRTFVSSNQVDVWSLRSIKTNMGSEIIIDYESDQYSKAALTKNYPLIINRFSNFNSNAGTVDVAISGGVTNAEYFYKTGDFARLVVMFNQTVHFDCDSPAPGYKRAGSFGGNVMAIDGNVVTINSPNMVDFFTKYNYDDGTTSGGTQDDEPSGGGGHQEPDLPYCDRGGFTVNSPIGGNIGVYGEHSVPGGDLRVASIGIVSAENNEIRKTIYEYTKSDDRQVESGVTSYSPILLDKYEYYDIDPDHQVLSSFRQQLYSGFSSLIAISREVPAPGVMYEYVTVKEGVKKQNEEMVLLPNYSVYQFEVFDESLVKHHSSNTYFDDKDRDRLLKDGFDIRYDRSQVNKAYLKDYTSRVGNLKAITLYDDQGNPINETRYNYLHDQVGEASYEELLSEEVNNQGVVQETFVNSRATRNDDGTYDILGVVAQRHQYPSVLLEEVNKNYKTGITSSSKNLAFDFYSGSVIKTLTNDGYGNSFISESIPAYTLSDYSGSDETPGMGLKILNPMNKHMITQGAGSKTYKVNAALEPTHLVGASVQTWVNGGYILGDVDNESENVWRTKATYSWKGDNRALVKGLYPYSSFRNNEFDGWDGAEPTSSQWKKNGEVTLYDIYSHALEATDINGNYAATKMDPEQKMVIATVANANYDEMAYSSVEHIAGSSLLEGGVNNGEGFATTARSHTGQYSLQVAFGDEGFSYNISGDKVDLNKKYVASVWLYLPGESETEKNIGDAQMYYKTKDGIEREVVSPKLQKNKSKSWYLLEMQIDPQGQEVTIGCRNNTDRNVYFDDFRVHPLDAAMTSYVYDPFSEELIYILDANNFYTHFEYDGMGRLVRTTKELLNFDFGDGKESFRADKVIGETIYNFKEIH